ncbi:MAG: lactate utilization protein [Oscillospiraceae bacterium]|nr:lactate utilization protein [Oscillospiraceae bacterium]
MSLDKVSAALKSRGFTVTCFETKEEAADYLVSLFENEVIGIGGSHTIEELDVYERLCEKNTIWWYKYDQRSRRMYGDFTAYLSSVNGVSETGELVNIDGIGNRIASTIYGPKRVVFVVGRNKITPDLPSAMERAQKVAGPPNAKRLNKKTPCAVTGKCADCRSPDRICGAMSIHMKPLNGFEKPEEIILINEDLGY